MSFFNNSRSEETNEFQSSLSLDLKFVYWLKKLYRFSESELKLHLGKDSKYFIKKTILQKSQTDGYYYCNSEFLKNVCDGNIDAALFYNSLTLAQLKQIVPEEFHEGSKNDLVTKIVRDQYKIFPKVGNIDDSQIKNIINVLFEYTDLRSQFNNNSHNNDFFEFSPLHYFYRRPVYSMQPEVVYKDVTAKNSNLFSSGYLHCLIHKNPISCCIVLNPKICAKVLDSIESKIKATRKELLENIPDIKVNPSDVEYHENKLSLHRIIAYFLAALENEELTLTADFNFRVSDLKTFWKNIFQESLADNQVKIYENILGILFTKFKKDKYVKLSLENRINLISTISKDIPQQYKEALLNFPKNKWIPVENLFKIIPCSQILTKEQTAICDVDKYLEMSSNEYFQEEAIKYLLTRKIFEGDVDLDISIFKKDKKKIEKKVKNFRVIEKDKKAEKIDENPDAKILIENNLTITLPPDLPLEKLLLLLEIFSPKSLNLLELDKNSIFRFRKKNMTFKMACDHIESILKIKLPKSALDFIQKELPIELSTITLYPHNRLISLTNSKDMPKVMEAVGNDLYKVIDDKFIILKPWTTLGSLKNKFKNRKIILEVDDLEDRY